MLRGRWRRLGAGLMALLLLILLALTWTLSRSLPDTRGEIAIAALDGPVLVLRDRWGVPHIQAESELDVHRALGFAHAQDRLWQMELQRRIGSGRLSELFGEASLETDQFLRTLGLHRAAAAAWEDHLSADARAVLEAYAEGVNAFLEAEPSLPPEFRILRHQPEPWRPIDSLSWTKMMSWDLSNEWDQELLRWKLAQALGPERAAQLLPGYPEGAPTILGRLPTWSPDMAGLLAVDGRLRRALGMKGKDVGSNAWAVAGRHTQSGGALLAGDPHLGAQIPAVWYLAELRGGEYQVTGATLPGVPGVVLGRNRHLGWSMTNLNPDVQDLYVERLDAADPNRYQTEGGSRALEIIEERIEVKGRDEPLHWAARATRHGPLISDVIDSPLPLALRWTALDPDDTTIEAFLGMNRARDWTEFKSALEAYVTPSQNIVYADVEGNIGFFGPGRIPIRADGDGSLPALGYAGEQAWSGFIPFEDLPQAFNPPSGFVVTANHRVAPDDYPHHLGSDWAAPYRAARIAERLVQARDAGSAGIDLETMRSIQADQLSLQAAELLPMMRGLEARDDRQAEALALLEDWDGMMDVGSAAAALYQAWLRALPEVVLSDDLSGDLLEEFLTRRHALFLADMLSDPTIGGAWCDDLGTPAREDCDAVLAESLDLALEDLEERVGPEPAGWRWGDLHRTRYAHNPFSQVAFLKPFFHRSIENGGGPYTVNAANVDLEAAYDQANHPSFRQRLDLGDPSASRFTIPTGQSGHPLSPHYDDLIELHRDVKDLPMRLDAELPEGDRLWLQPAE